MARKSVISAALENILSRPWLRPSVIRAQTPSLRSLRVHCHYYLDRDLRDFLSEFSDEVGVSRSEILNRLLSELKTAHQLKIV